MKIKYTLSLLSGLLAFPIFAANTYFCPKTFKTISLGMTEAEVLSACGTPIAQQESNKPFTKKIPMLQLTYNNEGPPRANVIPGTSSGIYAGLYGNATAISGVKLQVDIVDNKVYAVKIDGSSENAFSVCGGRSVEIGDPVAKVYYACGTPLQTNQTYIVQNIVGANKPMIWIYQQDQYHPPVNLTFTDGKLQSIE